MNNFNQLPPSYFDPATGNPYSHKTPPPAPEDKHTPHVPPEPPLYQYTPLQKLNDRHKMMAEFQVMGWTQTNIAREFGLTQPYVWKIQNDPTYRIYLEELRKRVTENQEFDIQAFLNETTEDTFRANHALIQNSDDEKVRQRAIENFMDRQSPKVNKIDRRDESVIRFETNTLGKAIGAFVESLGMDPAMVKNMSEDEVIDLLEENVDGNLPEPRRENAPQVWKIPEDGIVENP